MSKRPGIVQVGKFIASGSKTFSTYINYMDRNEAMRTAAFNKYNAVDYDGYNDYMTNPIKSDGLFTQNRDSLNTLQREHLKNLFKTAQDNGSVMWQNVISFDNSFLASQGIYNMNTQELNQQELRTAIRAGMDKLLEKEGLDNSAVWSASIHLNTDNIHVHVATVEPNPTRPYKKIIDPHTNKTTQERKGYIKKSSYEIFKSTVANTLLNRNQSLERLSQLIREKLPNNESWQSLQDNKYLTMYRNIHSRLPADRRLWKYNNNAMNGVRPFIDQLSTQYLLEYKPELLNEFDSMLKKEVVFREALYGTGQQGKEFNRAQDYLKNKYHELYSKMGNSVLNEMRETDKRLLTNHSADNEKEVGEFKAPNQSAISSLRAIKQIKRHFSNAEQEMAVKRYERELDRNEQKDNQQQR